MSYQPPSRYRSPRGSYADAARYQNPVGPQDPAGYQGGAGYRAATGYPETGAAGYGSTAGHQDRASYLDPEGYQDRAGYLDPEGYQDRAGYLDPEGYRGLSGYQDPYFTGTASYQEPELAAAARGTDGWGTGGRSRHGRGSRGLLAGIVTGLLSGAVAIGVAILAAAFVRPQASPVIAVGGAAIDRTPSAVKEFAIQYFGQNDKNVLLLGMYVVIAIIAMIIGILARQRLVAGIIGMAGFGLFGAFAALTRPESSVTDVVPSLIGGAAGVAALVYLVWAAVSQARGAATQRPGAATTGRLPRRHAWRQ